MKTASEMREILANTAKTKQTLQDIEDKLLERIRVENIGHITYPVDSREFSLLKGLLEKKGYDVSYAPNSKPFVSNMIVSCC